MATPFPYHGYRARISDPTLRRFYESVDCARIFNTRYLLDNAEINLTGNYGRLALTIACRISDERSKIRSTILEWLLKKGCDYQLPDVDGLTLLAYLCKWDKEDMCQQLVKVFKMEIKYNTPDKNGDIALIHAVRTGNQNLVLLLVKTYVQLHVDVDVRNKEGLTAYGEARRLKFDDIANILVNEGYASKTVCISSFLEEQKISAGLKFEQQLITKVKPKEKDSRQQIRRVSATLYKPRQNSLSTDPQKQSAITGKQERKESINKNTNLSSAYRKKKVVRKKISVTKNFLTKQINSKDEFTTIDELEHDGLSTHRDSSVPNQTSEPYKNKNNLLRKTSNHSFDLRKNRPFSKSNELRGRTSHQISKNNDEQGGSQKNKISRNMLSQKRRQSVLKRRESITPSSISENIYLENLSTYKNEFEKLMEYKSKDTANEKLITYKDLRSFSILTISDVDSNSTCFENISWLLGLQAEQQNHCYKQSVYRCNSDNRYFEINHVMTPKISSKRKNNLINAAMQRVLKSL